MAIYRIKNPRVGFCHGHYEADSPESAISAMLADAGWTDYPRELVADELTLEKVLRELKAFQELAGFENGRATQFSKELAARNAENRKLQLEVARLTTEVDRLNGIRAKLSQPAQCGRCGQNFTQFGGCGCSR